MLAYEERLALSDEDRKKGAAAGRSGKEYFRKYPTIIPEIPPDGSPQEEFDAVILLHNEAMEAKHGSFEVVPIGWLAFLSDEPARKMLDRLFKMTWDPKLDDAAYVLDRFGLEMFTGLLENGKDDASYADAYQRYAAVNATLVESPRTAALLAKVAKNKALKQAMATYFGRFPEAAAIGVLPMLLAKETQKAAKAAITVLLTAGHERVVLEVAERYGEPTLKAAKKLL